MVGVSCRIAGLPLTVEARHDQVLEGYRVFCDPGSEPPELDAHASDAWLERVAADGLTDDPAILEGDALYRIIGDWLPLHDRMILHGVAVEYRGRGFVFMAPSGTGKSTHALLWRQHLDGGMRILSGDKPVVSLERGEGEGPAGPAIRVWGSPWGGKECIVERGSAPLCGICLIRRGARNAIEHVEPLEFLDTMLAQSYVPGADPAATRALGIIDAILGSVPLWALTCDMAEEAAIVSFESLTGLSYDECRARRGVPA